MKLQKKIISSLLFCGIISTILYIVSDIVCAIVYPGYNYINQTISELSAIGSPTTSLWKTLTFMFSPLIIAFGVGVFLSAKKIQLRIAGIFLILFGISGYAWLFFPMNMRGSIGSASDTGHLILSAVTVTLLILILVFGSTAMGKKFKIYSIFTIIIMLVFGFLVAVMAPKVALDEPTPLMGIFERISVFSSMIWMSILAFLLFKKQIHRNT